MRCSTVYTTRLSNAILRIASPKSSPAVSRPTKYFLSTAFPCQSKHILVPKTRSILFPLGKSQKWRVLVRRGRFLMRQAVFGSFSRNATYYARGFPTCCARPPFGNWAVGRCSLGWLPSPTWPGASAAPGASLVVVAAVRTTGRDRPARQPGARVAAAHRAHRCHRLKEPGGSGDDWRVHLGYDLLAGRLVDVRVADRHTAEAFELFEVGPGDALVADRGYSRRRKSGLCAGAWGSGGRPPGRAASSPAR